MSERISSPLASASRIPNMFNWQPNWQPNWQYLAEANGRMMQGMMSLFQHQMELAQKLAAENYAELETYRDGKRSAASPAEQVELAHKRFVRTVAAMRQLTDEAYECCFDSATIASGAVPPAAEPGKLVGLADKPPRKAA